jgi:hypothetical protein
MVEVPVHTYVLDGVVPTVGTVEVEVVEVEVVEVEVVEVEVVEVDVPGLGTSNMS